MRSINKLAEDKKSNGRLGVVLIDHGSREAGAGEVLESIASVLSSLRPSWQIVTAHLGLQLPDLDEAVEVCKRKGVDRVLVQPYFIARGRHSSRDIPDQAKVVSEKFDLPIVVAEPLGFDPRLVEVVLERLEDVI